MASRLKQTFIDFMNNETLRGDQIVQLLLVITMVAAGLHLVTMLVTRWGDRHTALKSLAGSILVHMVCFLGLSSSAAFEPRGTRQSDDLKKPEQIVPIRNVVVESDRDVQQREHGNTSVFDQLPRDVNALDRLEHDSSLHQPAPVIREQADDTATETVPLRDIENVVKSPELPSEPVDAGETAERRNAAAPIETEDQTEESRSDVAANTRSRTTERARSGNPDETVTRQTRQGSAGRIGDQFEGEVRTPQMTESRDSGDFRIVDKPEDVASRTTGPVPAPTELTEAGAETTEKRTGAAGADSRSRIAEMRARRTRRSGRAEDDTRLEQNPSTPIPLEEGFDVRESPAFDPTRDSVIFRPAPVRIEDMGPVREPVPATTYKLRDVRSRETTARKNGGTRKSEEAVERSLKWLARTQHAEGFWDADEFGAGRMRADERKNGVVAQLAKGDDQPAGARADTGVTALAVLAFLGAGYTHEDGRYQEQVRKALSWLVRQQDQKGSLAGNATYFARMYCHGMATYALAEAVGMQDDPFSEVEYRVALMKAVSYIAVSQDPVSGGWRYVAGQTGDVSMFGWQMMALKSAEIAGVPIPAITKSRMARFLKARRVGVDKGLASYRVKDRIDPVMTAEALFCRQMSGYPRNGDDAREAIRYLMRHQPGRRDLNLYYWYYGTLALFQYGGEEWNEWNGKVRDLLIDEQIKTGEYAGTWAHERTRWGRAGGRVYTTAIATLTLEVYYRFLPLYRAAAPQER